MVNEIVTLIKNSRTELKIITPYLNLNARMKGALNKAKNNGVKVIVYYRFEEKSKKKNADDIVFLLSEINAEVVYIERLHSKLYLNEREAVMSSMNLVAGSQDDSQEIGIHTNEERLVGDFNRYAENLYLEKMEDDEIIIKKEFKKSSKRAESSNDGYCIRTGEKVPFDLKKPFSDKAFKSWNRFKNPEFIEKYCHYSGEEPPGGTSFGKPILRKHWSAAKKKHGL